MDFSLFAEPPPVPAAPALPAAPAPLSPAGDGGSGLSVGALIGIVVGATCGVLVLAAGFYLGGGGGAGKRPASHPSDNVQFTNTRKPDNFA